MLIDKFLPLKLFFALLVLVLAAPNEVMSAEHKPPAVLIIDGSGSMWGRLNKREKIVIVRQELARQLDLLRPRVELGVMSYGHRRRRDCRDIEMIVPISPIDKKAHSQAVKRLLPRGKTPIYSALEMAAQGLEAARTTQTKGQASHIILVADGIENCRRDPCETASALKA